VGGTKGRAEEPTAGLEAELQEYETLKTDGPRILELDSLEGLPKVLIQARIAAGLRRRI
jgi:hypothetical protein